MKNTLNLAISLLCVSFALTKSTEIYNSDTYGNVVYKNGTVVYVRPVPVGNVTYDTKMDYDAQGLDLLYDSARSFIHDIQPNSFPFDLLEDVANGTFDLYDDYPKIIEHFYGLTVCVAIGLLFVVVFIIGGCCLLCCRCCCGNCGGDEIQVFQDNEGCLRMGLSQALVLMMACVFSAAICIYVTNDRFTKALDFTNKSVTTNIDDIDSYLKNTGQEFQYLVTDMYDVVHFALQKDIENIGELAKENIFDNLNVMEVIRMTESLDYYLNKVNSSLSKTYNNIIDLQTAASTLESALETLADSINITQGSCLSDCSPNTCSDIDASSIRGGAFNANSLPDLNTTMNEVQNVKSRNNFTHIALEALNDVNGIASTIDSASSDVKSAVNKTLTDYRKLIYSLSSSVFTTMTTAFPAEDIKKETKDIFETVSVYDDYRRWLGLALTIAFTALVLLYMVALILGFCFYDESVLPTERHVLSNLGGNLLLIAVAATFILGTLLLVLTILVFLFGTLLEITCEPAEDLTLFRDFLDTDKVPDYSLSKFILGDETLKLNTYEVLMGCRADKAPWTVLKLSEVVALEDALKYVNYVGDIGDFLKDIKDIDISFFRLLSKELEKGLNEVENIDLNSIDFIAIANTTNQSAVSFDVQSTLTSMKVLQNACSNPSKTRWSDHILKLNSINSVERIAVERAITQLKSSLDVLEEDAMIITNLTTSIRLSATLVDKQLQDNMTNVLLQATVGLTGRIFFMLEGYASEVIYLIYNELGNCLPLWNLYKSFTVVLCDYGVDTLNGYWFSIGWGLLFFGPLIIVALQLVKHYKIMENAIGYQEFDDMTDLVNKNSKKHTNESTLSVDQGREATIETYNYYNQEEVGPGLSSANRFYI